MTQPSSEAPLLFPFARDLYHKHRMVRAIIATAPPQAPPTMALVWLDLCALDTPGVAEVDVAADVIEALVLDVERANPFENGGGLLVDLGRGSDLSCSQYTPSNRKG